METFSDLIYALDGALALIEVLEQQTLVQPIMFFCCFFFHSLLFIQITFVMFQIAASQKYIKFTSHS